MKSLVFVEKITSRIAYTFDFVFNPRGILYEFTTDALEFNSFKGSKLNYSNQKLTGKQIIPSSLLFDGGVRKYNINKAHFKSLDCLSFNEVSDPIASIFYTISRYEEYISHKKDVHGRFPFSESYLKTYGWIEKCMCDRWAVEVLKLLNIDFRSENKGELIPTFDIDNTYAHKLKTGSLKILSICKDFLQLNFERISERRAVHKGEKDPYDTFDLIREIGAKHKKTILFWLVGERAKYDKNISIYKTEHQKLIKDLDKKIEVNLHPSYNSNGSKEVIGKEKFKLEKVINRTVIKSRQHFLRFNLPETYNSIVDTGFLHEYSMGFAEHVGFRSGTARPFFWYDLVRDEKTHLLVHPFAYMDGSLNEYMHLSIDESKTKIQELYDEVCNYGGDFVFIWHNETIGDYKKWNGWSEVLRFTLNLKNE